MDITSAAAEALQLSLPAAAARSGSVAVSERGARYAAGYVRSKTHVLDIPSEVAALVLAVHHGDPSIVHMETVMADSKEPISPLVAKVLIDHTARTGKTISYRVTDPSGIEILNVPDAHELLPWYASPGVVSPSLSSREITSAKGVLDRNSGTSVEMQMRAFALAGRDRNFPTREGASGYGASVLTAEGTIYYGGQYSTFEHRLMVHAEMGVLLHALMDGARDITYIGIASSKHPDTPCSPCGPCRQFVAEFSSVYGFSPTFLLFASENEEFVAHTLDELLPVQWTNKK